MGDEINITKSSESVLNSDNYREEIKRSDLKNNKNLLKIFNFYNTNKSFDDKILDEENISAFFNDLLEFSKKDNNANKNTTQKNNPTNELDNWFLDYSTYILDPNESYISIETFLEKKYSSSEYFMSFLPSKNAINWYENYKKENGEMNFHTAVEYLNNNPDLSDEIKEYIKKSFAICDGDITKNHQGSKGTCHLLSCKAELDACSQLSDIINNIVIQNDDGTVKVTLFGILDDNNKPFEVILSNKEIRDSYKYIDKRGSSDPDAAALELAYQKFVTFITKKNKEYDMQMDKLIDKQGHVLIRDTYMALNNNKSDDKELNEVKQYLNENIEYFNSISSDEMFQKINDDNMYDKVLDFYFISDEYRNIYNETEQLRIQKYEFGERYILGGKDDYSEETWGETLGGFPEQTFQILTGLKAEHVKINLPKDFNWDNPDAESIRRKCFEESIDSFFQNTDITSTPIVLTFKNNNNKELDIMGNHAYSLKSIYIDETTGEKMVIVHNPHGYDIKPIPYDEFLTNIEQVSYINL